jgi:hypothetical protein
MHPLIQSQPDYHNGNLPAVDCRTWHITQEIKKPGAMAGQGYQIPGESGSLQNTVLFLAANFTFFKDRHDGHQADTADGGGIQRRKGARPAGEAENGVPSAIIPRPSLAKLSPIR